MRLAGLLGDKEGIDSPGFTDQGDVGADALADGFQKGEIGRSGQVPILGVAHYEIENVLAARNLLNHGGVTHSGTQADYLVRIVAYPDHRGLRRFWSVSCAALADG